MSEQPRGTAATRAAGQGLLYLGLFTENLGCSRGVCSQVAPSPERGTGRASAAACTSQAPATRRGASCCAGPGCSLRARVG